MNSGRFIWLFLFWGLSVSVFAQTRTIDNLKKKVATAENIKEKSEALLNLCSQKYSLAADTLHKYASELKKLVINTPDSHFSIMADYYLAYSLLINNKEDSCLKITDNYLGVLKENKNESQAYLLFYQLKGLVYYRSGRSEETVNAFFELRNVATQRKDTLFMLLAERGIGLSYLLQGQDKEAIKLFNNALSLIPDTTSEKYMEVYGHLLINAGIASMHLYQATHARDYADSAEHYADDALRIARKEENLFILCQGLVLKGLMLSYRGKYDEAEKSLHGGLEIRKMIADTVYIISDMTVLASFYANTGQPEKGISICKKGIELAQRKKSSFGLLLLLNNSLAENYLVAKDYKQYGETIKNLILIKDSLNKKKSAYELNYLQAQFETQTKEKKIIEQELQITKRNYWLYGTVIFSIMGIIIGWLIFINYRRRQRHKLKLLLEEEKRISNQAVKDAEEHERKRIAADLHDNLGVYAASLSSNLGYLRPDSNNLMSKNAFQELKLNSNAIISELNDTIWVLKKEALSLTAISDRVKSFINRIQNSYPEIKIEVEEKIKDDCKLPSFQAFHLYHIIKEAINNSLKHSKGKNIIVTIESDNYKWSVSINDDGMGFVKPDKNSKEEGSGLKNMKNRCDEAGWDINWSQQNDRGTMVTITTTTN